jgi:drug/metabolite transporter (DMT)-like permease
MRRLLVLAFIWGWSFVFIKVAVEGMTPTTVAWARIALGAAVLHLIVRRQGLALPTDRVTLRHFAVLGVVGCGLPFTLLAWGEQHITSALASVLNASTPLFTAVFAAVVGADHLRRPQVLGLAAGIVGVSVAAGVGSSDLRGSSLAGTVAAILAGACYGVAFVYIRRHAGGLPPLVGAAGQLTAGALLLTPFALVTSLSEGISLTPNRVGAIVLLGAVGTGLAFAINYGIVAELGPTKASLVTYLVPVVAVVAGIVVLGEPFQWRIPAGGALTIAGVAAVTLGRRVATPSGTAISAPDAGGALGAVGAGPGGPSR